MSVRLITSDPDSISWTTNIPNVESFTAMVWFKKSAASGVQPNVISLGVVGGSGRSLYLASDADLTLWDGSGSTAVGVTVDTTNWYVLVLRGSGTEIKAYAKINGAANFTTLTGTQGTGIAEDKLCLGKWLGDTDYMNGLLRAFKQWNVALTDGEIDVEAGSFAPVVTSGLQRYIPLSIDTDTNDQSGNGFNPTIEGVLDTSADNPTEFPVGSKLQAVERGRTIGRGFLRGV